jgi:hypothetical protein
MEQLTERVTHLREIALKPEHAEAATKILVQAYLHSNDLAREYLAAQIEGLYADLTLQARSVLDDKSRHQESKAIDMIEERNVLENILDLQIALVKKTAGDIATENFKGPLAAQIRNEILNSDLSNTTLMGHFPADIFFRTARIFPKPAFGIFPSILGSKFESVLKNEHSTHPIQIAALRSMRNGDSDISNRKARYLATIALKFQKILAIHFSPSATDQHEGGFPGFEAKRFIELYEKAFRDSVEKEASRGHQIRKSKTGSDHNYTGFLIQELKLMALQSDIDSIDTMLSREQDPTSLAKTLLPTVAIRQDARLEAILKFYIEKNSPRDLQFEPDSALKVSDGTIRGFSSKLSDETPFTVNLVRLGELLEDPTLNLQTLENWTVKLLKDREENLKPGIRLLIDEALIRLGDNPVTSAAIKHLIEFNFGSPTHQSQFWPHRFATTSPLKMVFNFPLQKPEQPLATADEITDFEKFVDQYLKVPKSQKKVKAHFEQWGEDLRKFINERTFSRPSLLWEFQSDLEELSSTYDFGIETQLEILNLIDSIELGLNRSLQYLGHEFARPRRNSRIEVTLNHATTNPYVANLAAQILIHDLTNYKNEKNHSKKLWQLIVLGRAIKEKITPNSPIRLKSNYLLALKKINLATQAYFIEDVISKLILDLNAASKDFSGKSSIELKRIITILRGKSRSLDINNIHDATAFIEACRYTEGIDALKKWMPDLTRDLYANEPQSQKKIFIYLSAQKALFDFILKYSNDQKKYFEIAAVFARYLNLKEQKQIPPRSD